MDDVGAAEVPAESYALAPEAHNLLITGKVSSVLLWLALPVLGEQFLHLFVGLVDTYLAGTVNKEATAAIGLASQMAWLVNLVFGFVGVGATALVSRHAGMGAPDRANHFSNQALGIALLLGVAEFALMYILAPLLPRILQWHDAPAEMAVLYLRIDCWGYMLYSLTVIGAACWRGFGDTRTPLYVMLGVNACNMLVSASLRFGWGPLPVMGVKGIAIGTLVARLLGGGIVLLLLIHGRSGIRMQAREMWSRADSVRRLLRVGVPAGIDGLLLWLGQFLFLGIISNLKPGQHELQAAIVAAHFIGIRVEALSYLPAFAWATAAATLVGQSLGAGDPRRASQAGHLATLQGCIMCAVMGVIYFAFAGEIYWLFNRSPDFARVTAIGVPALRALAFFQIPLAMMIIYINALRGAGDTRFPLLFTVVGMLMIRLPLAYIGGVVLDGGLMGAWIGMFADMTVRAALSTARFVRGKWQRIAV